MIKKQYIKSRKTCKITFEIPPSELPEGLDVENVALVGSFNDWDESSTLMKKNSKGVYKAQVEVEPGQQIEFRYLANGKHWFNAWNADGYIPSGQGPENCVITAVGPSD